MVSKSLAHIHRTSKNVGTNYGISEIITRYAEDENWLHSNKVRYDAKMFVFHKRRTD